MGEASGAVVQSQTGSEVSGAAWDVPQSPADYTDEILHGLLSNDPSPLPFDWMAPPSEGVTGVGSQHSSLSGGGAAAGAAPSAHMNPAPSGSEPGGWAASQMGGASGAVVQSQTGSVLPAAGWPPLQSSVPSTDGAYNWFSDERPPSMPSFAAPPSGAGGALGGFASGGAASAGTPSTRRSVQDLGIANRINQPDFDHVANAVEQGSSVRAALNSIGLQNDIPESSMRRWLRNDGVEFGGRFGRPQSPFSATQIALALQARNEHISRTGSHRGSSRAAYDALGGSIAGNLHTFRDYVSDEGFTAYGQAMLAQARAASSTTSSRAASTRRSVQDLGIEEHISQPEFDRVVTAVHENNRSTSQALRDIGRADIETSDMWQWLNASGAMEQSRQ
jgi:hypothetical protein